ncbi:MAG: hypothetical protein K2X47_06630 [Bdellovibrionales bacterium]|nr:hypothetical protein [Bdellovibrionales bacterium]
MIRIAVIGILLFGFIVKTSVSLAKIPSAIQLARVHQYDKVGDLSQLPRFLWMSEECAPPAQKLLGQLLNYHQMAIRSTKPTSSWAKKAKLIYEEIYLELLRLETETPQCFDSVARAYAVGAVAMLESSYDQALLKLASYFAYDLPGWNQGTETPRISILSSARRPKMGCGWAKPGQKYAFKSFGGYFCKNSVIAIDPFLPPSNLAASFIHEIDHLLRDKYGRVGESWDEVRELTIYDEALSATLSSFLQLRLSLWPQQFVKARSWHLTPTTTTKVPNFRDLYQVIS